MILRLEQTTRCITMKEKPDKVPSLRFPNVYAFLITLLIKRKQTNENKNKAATPKTNKEKNTHTGYSVHILFPWLFAKR